MQHVEVPVPSAKKNELLLKLEAAAINPVDWKIQKGLLRPLLPRKFPFIPGKSSSCLTEARIAVLVLVPSLDYCLCIIMSN